MSRDSYLAAALAMGGGILPPADVGQTVRNWIHLYGVACRKPGDTLFIDLADFRAKVPTGPPVKQKRGGRRRTPVPK